MKIYKNQNLRVFVDYYYKNTFEKLPSRHVLSSNLNISDSKLKRLLNIFEKCNYIYSTGHGFKIFNTKRNFTAPINCKDKGNYLVYSNHDYSISFNKLEFDLLEPNFEINTVEDLIYMLFLFTIEFKYLIHPIIYIKNNEIWYKKSVRVIKIIRFYLCVNLHNTLMKLI